MTTYLLKGTRNGRPVDGADFTSDDLDDVLAWAGGFIGTGFPGLSVSITVAAGPVGDPFGTEPMFAEENQS